MRFWRDCEICKRYLIDDKGRVMRDGEKNPIVNPSPPVCERTSCWDADRKCLRPRFTDEEVEVWRRWQYCRLLHIAPAPGSLSDQNPWEMEMYRILELWEKQADQKNGAGALGALLGALTGRKL